MDTPVRPLPAIVDDVEWEFRHYDVQTLDLGRTEATVQTHVFRDGELLVTRHAPYLPAAPEEFLRHFMRGHHDEVVEALKAGELREDIAAAARGRSSRPLVGAGLHSHVPERARFHENPAALSSSATEVLHHPPDGDRPRRFQVVMRERRALVDLYYERGKQHGMMLETTEEVPLGATVDIQLRFHGEHPRHFNMRGVVTSRRHKGAGSLKPGVSVEFTADSRVAVDRAVELALGVMDHTLDRQHPRLACSFDGRVAAGKDSWPVKVDNMSLGGVMVSGARVFPAGSVVDLSVKTGLLSSVRAACEVRWVRQQPPALGLMFVESEDLPREKIASVVGGLLRRD